MISRLTNLQRGVLAGLVAVLAWSIFNVASKHASEARLLDGWDLVFLRYAVSGPVFLPLFWSRRQYWLGERRWLKAIALAAIAGPGMVFLTMTGFAYAPLEHGAVLNPAFAAIGSIALAVLVGRSALRSHHVVGLLLLVVGLVSISGAGASQPGAWRGDVLFIAAGLLWATFAFHVQKWSLRATDAVSAVAVLGFAVIAPLYLVMRSRGLADVSIPYLGLQGLAQGVAGGIAGTTAFSIAVRHLGAERAGVLPALAPAATLVLGGLVLGKHASGGQWLGMIPLVAGLLVVTGTLSQVLALLRPSRFGAAAATAP
jgi:drug/metabolite transporter (DMT)-like permease